MNFIGSNSERFHLMRLRPYFLISALSIAIFVSLLVPQASGSEARRDIVMMVDNSGSMKKNDPEFLARRALKAFISENDDKTRVALITFDHNVNLSIPFTPLTDASRPILLDAIQEIDYSGSLTMSPAALERAIYEIALHSHDNADKSIIFVTDGIVDTGNKARDKQQEVWMLEDLAALASKLNIRIFSIAFAEAANYKLIQNLAYKTKGDYFKVLLAEDLPRVFARLEEIYRPAVTPMSREIQQPRVALDTQPPIDTNKKTQKVGKNDSLSAPVKNDGLNETLDTTDSLKEDKELAEPKPISIPKMLWNKAQHLYTNNEAIILSALFICLTVFAVIAVSRKRTARRSRPRLEHDSSVNEAQMRALLIDINSFTSSRNHPLSKRITRIGRANTGKVNDDIHHLLIDKPTIGREHALIEYKDGGYWLVDQESTNGTFINGKRISGRVRLKDGNRICFHDVEFIFSVPDLNKFDKTVNVAIGNWQEKTDHQEDAIIARKPDNRHTPQTPSTANLNAKKKTYVNINAYKLSKAKARFKSALEGQEHAKSCSTISLEKRNISDDHEHRPSRSIINRVRARNALRNTPEVKPYAQIEGDTINLNITKLPPTAINTDERALEPKQSDTEKSRIIPSSHINGNATEPMGPIEGDYSDLDVSQLSPNTNAEQQTLDLKGSDTVEISVMPSSKVKEKKKDLKNPVNTDTVDLGNSQPHPRRSHNDS